MWKNLKIYLSNLSIIALILAFTPLVCAQVDTEGSSSDLVVDSHIIRVSQGLREEETFYYGITEEMEFENRGVGVYQGSLAFWVGEGEDLRVVAFGEGGNDVNLEVSTNEGIATAILEKEGVFIKPRQKLRVNLDYKVFFTDAKKKEEFQKKILYPQTKESLQFKVNPVENIGFKPQLKGFSLEPSKEESGWFVSPKISPRLGEIYFLRIVKEREGPVLPEEKEEVPSFGEQPEEEVSQKQKEERGPVVVADEIDKIPEQIRVFSAGLKRWIWENILLVVALNDVLVLTVVGYKCGWFKKFSFKIPQFFPIALPKRRKSGKRKTLRK